MDSLASHPPSIFDYEPHPRALIEPDEECMYFKCTEYMHNMDCPHYESLK